MYIYACTNTAKQPSLTPLKGQTHPMSNSTPALQEWHHLIRPTTHTLLWHEACYWWYASLLRCDQDGELSRTVRQCLRYSCPVRVALLQVTFCRPAYTPHAGYMNCLCSLLRKSDLPMMPVRTYTYHNAPLTQGLLPYVHVRTTNTHLYTLEQWGGADIPTLIHTIQTPTHYRE